MKIIQSGFKRLPWAWTQGTEKDQGARGTWLGAQGMAARFITVVGVVIRHVGPQRTPPEEDKQIEPKQRFSRAKERHKAVPRPENQHGSSSCFQQRCPELSQEQGNMRDLLGVVTRHLSHPLSWLPTSCRDWDNETPRLTVVHDQESSSGNF